MLAAAAGIDLVGWCEMAPFPGYLEAIATRPEYHRFDYRPVAEFVAAGEAWSDLPRVLVLVAYYYREPTRGPGLRVSNYSRFCWDTILPRADEVMAQVQAAGYRIERIDLPARATACRAGLGTIGRNCMFYAPGLGSYVAIETLATNLPLQTDVRHAEQVANPTCEGCRRCIEACPTQAIASDGYHIDPLRCLSFVNRHLDEPGRIVPAAGGSARRWLHGCETCKDVCPMNRGIKHRRQVVGKPELDLEGLRVPNQPAFPPRLIAAGIHRITYPGYRDYVARLLASG